jgi:hypothetical protein
VRVTEVPLQVGIGRMAASYCALRVADVGRNH